MRCYSAFLLLFLAAPAQAATITCESEGNRYRYCRAEIRGDVRLSRQLSSADCREGRSWGYDRGGVWVDRGCRAEFSLGRGHHDRDDRDHGRNDRDDNDDTAAVVAAGIIALGVAGALSQDSETAHDADYQVLRCESRDEDRHHCDADIRGRVRLHRQLGRVECIEGDTWGEDRRGIWVDDGCRAEFRIYR